MFSSQNSQVSQDANFIEDVFSTWLYNGNSSTQTISNGIDLAGKGGLVWIKARNTSTGHALFNTSAGRAFSLASNTTDPQISSGAGLDLASFNATGFTLGDDSQRTVNSSGLTFASWTFREQPKFFDVVTWTGTGGSRAISHALTSTPGCIIIKRTDAADNWYVVHRGAAGGFNDYGILNNTNAFAAGSEISSVNANSFTVSSFYNGSGSTWVAYVFASNAGGFGLTGTDNVISCGSFTTDGNGTIPETALGYEPQYVMFKASSTTGAWTINDTMRGQPTPATANASAPDATLYANNANAESQADNLYPTATGFKGVFAAVVPSTTYIYIAIRRGPMKVPTTGTSVYNAVTVTGNSTANRRITGYGFPLDLLLSAGRTGAYIDKTWNSRLTGIYYVRSTTAAAEDVQFGGLAGPPFAYQDGYQTGTNGGVQYYWNNSGDTYVQYGMRRAPGFFDVVCYTGTGVTRTVNHNLGVAPELIIFKGRSVGGEDWIVYATPIGVANSLWLNQTDSQKTFGSFYWNSTAASSNVFTVAGSSLSINASGSTYVAYLFASAPGVSKVGSYTGTGATQVINCGFTGGARFVLIKATSTTGSWYVWDSARGIVAGNDPYLLLNSTAAEVTNTDWVDTAATGFELSNAGGNLANSNGVSYIFLAIS
jgi:hypothetical protein